MYAANSDAMPWSGVALRGWEKIQAKRANGKKMIGEDRVCVVQRGVAPWCATSPASPLESIQPATTSTAAAGEHMITL
jgi:hypothetical protein